jgi:hypothetical protein
MAAIVDSYPLLLTLPFPLRAVRRYLSHVHRHMLRFLIQDFGAVLAI